MPKHDTPTDLSAAYAAAHERAVRLAYAVAGWAEDYPLPVGTALTWAHVLMLGNATNLLLSAMEFCGIPEPPPRGAQTEEIE